MSTVCQLVLERSERMRRRPALYVPPNNPFEWFDRIYADAPEDPPGWRGYTGAACERLFAAFVHRFHSLGVDRGVPVALVAQTSHAWLAVDLAVLTLGGITVGVYPTLTGEQVAYQVRHSESQVLIVEDQEQYDKIQPFLDDLPELRHVLALTTVDGADRLEPGEPDLDFMRERAQAVQPDDVATYVYTSGTTGEPKAAILTHGAFYSVVTSSSEVIGLRPGERSIVFLPLAHSLQRMTVYQGLYQDGVGYFSRSIYELPEAIAAARPHVLASVPRMLEKIRATAETRAAAKSPLLAKILAWAVAIGRERNKLQRAGQPLPLLLRAQLLVADRLVYRKFHERMGGNLRLLVSGGAALSVDVAEWFEAFGVQVREGWGLTETCAPATVNLEDDFKMGTVGRALPGVEMRVADDGEVEVKCSWLFKGYFKDAAATREAFTEDGFFRTGDIGEIDRDGFLRIVDRKKELIVTAGGKNISPLNLEKPLEGGLVGQAVVIGDDKPFLTALLAPDPEALEQLAKEQGWPGDFADWAAQPLVQQQMQEQVDRSNARLARFETVKKFAVLPAPLTTETGELTPTLKLKRRVIHQKYAALIDALYG